MAKSKSEQNQEKLNNLLTQELDTRKETRDILKQQLGLEDDLAVLYSKNVNANKEQAKLIGQTLDKAKEVLDNNKSITEENFQQVDLSKLERDLMREGVQDTGQIIAKLKEKQNIQKETNRIVNFQANTYKSIGDSIDGFVQKIPGIGGMLSEVLGTNELGKNMADDFRTSIEAAFKKAGGIGENISQGIVEGTTSGLIENMGAGRGVKQFFKKNITGGMIASFAGLGVLLSTGLSQGFQSLGLINTLKKTVFGGAFEGLREAFGNLDKATLSNLIGIRRLGFAFGIGADESAKILQAQTEISGLTDKQAIAIQRQVGQFASLRGVLPKDVLSDLANNTELFAKFAQDGGRNLGLAAVQAKELGLGLSTVGTIAESVLDFQTSIESELQASLLIGRQLNLNRARELALAGDLAGLQQEVVRLVGSEQELNKLNVIQRKSLANALGITVAELGRLAGGEVELKSTEVEQNTFALRQLTIATAGLAVQQGAKPISNIVTGLGFARVGRLVGGLGPIGAIVGGISALALVISSLKPVLQKTADSNDLIVGNTKGNKFTPFSSTEALAK